MRRTSPITDGQKFVAIVITAILICIVFYYVRSIFYPDEGQSTVKNDTPLLYQTPSSSADNSGLTLEQLKRKNDFGKYEAFFDSQEFVKRKISTPSTAEFGSNFEQYVSRDLDSLWVIDSYVDYQNEFGAMIRSRYLCKLSYNPVTDSVVCKNLIFLPYSQ